ncbi:methylenetetrahydrofolate--tRNA-(uracil(54)-C(5))-methyltransferase (FADH(2)-oxidizing) TrmFO [Chloroflexota bacterium]|nr:methylenetetrahydrofolate--tRNA-(uracil(54)-C(5))-methyltransferase (FADH(2)-oxidizing) TrmFO [Chloroflexota bacterium]
MTLKVIGGGLAGCEAAWQAAERDIDVELYEMRPEKSTGAHRTGDLGELVCSNSLGSNLLGRAAGLLKAELRLLGSMLISCADASSVPAGGALAVDRQRFSDFIQNKIENHPRIRLIRQELTEIPESPAMLATGPLTSPKMSESLKALTGEDQLYFYDAIAPIVHRESIDMSIAFRANRYDRDEDIGDYLNCPFTKEEYLRFREALLTAERIELRGFESAIEGGVDAGKENYFQGCQPVEVISGQGERSLAFGPMRPVGLFDPRTHQRPFAVVQLRQDNLAGDLYNLVGFQTNLTFPEQQRVFRMIPGLENATFERYGQMHRNTFIAAPLLLNDQYEFKSRPGLFAAGQLAGVEGYAGNVASGLVTGINAARWIKGEAPLELPLTTMTGALLHYVVHADLKDYQPTKAMFGLLPKPTDGVLRSKRDRYAYYSERALEDLEAFLQSG